MNENNDNKKLDWMYKGATSLVNREDYLLGRSVDKTLEQLNNEEKEKKLGIVPPKNHVEHECIPPSIRDFNKIVQAEQVDLSAKLQEDPLVAIKKREEEARRQFLQNPVQLKKLQEALKAQKELDRKKKHKKLKNTDSDSDLDKKILKKLKYLKGNGLPLSSTGKEKESSLDIILMHKFNQLKDRLTEEDMNDILGGKISDSDSSGGESDDCKRKQKSVRRNLKKSRQSDSDEVVKESKSKARYKKSSRELKNLSKTHKRIKKYSSSSDSDSSSSDSENDKKPRYFKVNHWQIKKKKRESSSEGEAKKTQDKTNRKPKHDRKAYSDDRRRTPKDIDKRINRKSNDNFINKNKHSQPEDASDSTLDNMILQKLKQLRQTAPISYETNTYEESHYSDKDSNDNKNKPRFGLMLADGTRLPLKNKHSEGKKIISAIKSEPVKKPERTPAKKLNERDKEELRRQMMKDAVVREKERSANLKKHREEQQLEEGIQDFDKSFVHKQLLKSTKNTSVEERIKSKRNNIQRSSAHMNSNFSKRY